MLHSWQQFRIWILHSWAPMTESYILACLCTNSALDLSIIHIFTHTYPPTWFYSCNRNPDLCSKYLVRNYPGLQRYTPSSLVITSQEPKQGSVSPSMHCCAPMVSFVHLSKFSASWCLSMSPALLCSAVPPEATANSTSMVEFHTGYCKALPQANWAVQN